MFQRIRTSKISKVVAVLLAHFFILEIVYPTYIFALTGGPSQPEVQSFEPVGTSEMVDLFTGDFTYNIPLLDVGGYPINISYHSGVTMDQEASWVGLGWNINPGVINRNMRALPDDFKGDEITKDYNVNKNETYGMNTGIGFELFGMSMVSLKAGLGLSYNNYRGYGFEMSVEPSLKSSLGSYGAMNVSLGLSASSEGGVGVSPNVSYDAFNQFKDKMDDEGLSMGIGLGFNSRSGLSNVNIGYDITKRHEGNKYRKGGNSQFSFAYPTYTPNIEMPMINSNISLSVTLGTEVFGGHANGEVSGYYSSQSLITSKIKNPAYGYMYMHEGDQMENVSLDFNREKDGSFTRHKPNLPIPSLTYDIYSVSGQGISGMYRPFRSDYGVIYDSKVTNISDGVSLGGIEFGVGAGVHGGLNYTINNTLSTSGKWVNDNDLNSLTFKGNEDVSDAYFEPYYFKMAGEKTTENCPEVLENIGNFAAVRVKLDNSNKAQQTLEDKNNNVIDIPATNYRTKRARRNEAISLKTADEAVKFALEQKIRNYTPNYFYLNTKGSYKMSEETGYEGLTRNNGYRKGHHISEMTTFRADGMRYVYGIAAYNTTQQDVTFAVAGDTPDCSTGLVAYSHGSNNTIGNTDGLDNYFSKTTLPAYAHSYLLTAVLSADYVDVNFDGPTDDDLGNYTKFNYSLVNDKYKWRVPFEKGMANYNEGFKSKRNADDDGDDKASYIYGEKELWYTHSIETKTHVAEFVLADRCDGYEVDTDAGGIGPESMKKLVRIDLFSKQDKIKNGTQAVPIKSVHFEYDYSLCPNIPNNKVGSVDNNEEGEPTGFENQGGKLTLKKIYFTYQKSKRGKLNPYVFKYAEVRKSTGEVAVNINPGYNLKGYDRWGSFMPNTETTNCSVGEPLTNPEFPYTSQEMITSTGAYSELYEAGVDRWLADVYATAWNLTSINLPSGGIINIDYEADDYGFVQDKKAMQMFKVIGTAREIEGVNPANLSTELYGSDKVSNSYLILKLTSPYSNNTEDLMAEKFKNDFLTQADGKPIEFLYFKFLLNLSENGQVWNNEPGKQAWEYVPGYAKLDLADGNYGFIDKDHAYVKLEVKEINDEVPKGPEVNPISQAGWNFIKLYLPRIAYGGPTPSKNILEAFDAIASTFKQIGSTFGGLCNQMRKNGSSRYFMPDKSWVRLYNPSQCKKGGGNRVKKITLNDQWKELTKFDNYSSAGYGQEYDYTLSQDDAVVSSGVAAYEPILGGDENPFKEPVFYEEKNLLVSSDDYYMEKPFGESFFPGASVGYSKVTVKSLQYEGLTKNATGKVEHEFYTAKDFPTITDFTGADPKRDRNTGVLKLLNIESHDYMTATQGYVVILNDMHGKPLSQKSFPENSENPISEITYYYKTKDRALDNEAEVIEKNGTISKQTIGVDSDFVIDMREQETETTTAGINGNLDFFMALFFPVVVPVVLPKYAHEKVRYRSVVTSKVINRYALLDYIEAVDNGSRISTHNKLYDAETGEVLLTETKNQYDDDVYSFTFPAHWAYDRMGAAYKNIGVSYTANSGEAVVGDEVIFDNNYGWVTNVQGGLKILNKKGEYFSNPSKMKVVRSGRSNQQSLPVGTVVSLGNPIDENRVGNGLSFTKVLSASAVEFTDRAGIFCGECGLVSGMNYNPYVEGARGKWKQRKSYLYLTDRTQSRANNNTNIRTDGVYKDFAPFWTPNNGRDWQNNSRNPKWVYSNEVTIFSPYGSALENRDALGRFSAAVYGYNQALPVATASNARYKEIAFDGFEDYDTDNCDRDHFSYEEVDKNESSVLHLGEKESHTGRRSMEVRANASIGVRKIVIPCPEAE